MAATKANVYDMVTTRIIAELEKELSHGKTLDRNPSRSIQQSKQETIFND